MDPVPSFAGPAPGFAVLPGSLVHRSLQDYMYVPGAQRGAATRWIKARMIENQAPRSADPAVRNARLTPTCEADRQLPANNSLSETATVHRGWPGCAWPTGDIAARPAGELLGGVRIGGGGPEFHHRAAAQVHNVRGVGLDALAALAGRGGQPVRLPVSAGRSGLQGDREPVIVAPPQARGAVTGRVAVSGVRERFMSCLV
jgi:hypothetical protein